MFTFIRENSPRRGLIAGLAVLTMTTGVLTASPAQAAAGKQSPANSTGRPATAPAGAAKPSADAPKLPDGHGPTPAEQRAMEAAAAKARMSGKSVVVDALTTPTVQVVALPGGGFQMADNPSPVRAQTRSAWAPIDTSLRKNPDGTFSPANIAYAKVTFGAAGSRVLATTSTPDGGSYQLSWPTALPAPTAAGSTLAYRGVLPGVDLLVAANASGGFSDTLVVHDAKAAANPALAKLVLPVRATGRADARSHTLATSPTGMALAASGALMWDSSTGPGRQAHADPSTAHTPGQAARTAVIGMKTTSQALTLTPDPRLLRGSDTKFPLYIDPSYTWHNSGTLGTQYFDEVKQYGPCASQTYTNNSGSSADYGQLSVGYASSGYPNYSTCSGDQRTFYQWKLPSYINQAHINTATVGVTEVWQASFSCSYSHTINLHWSGGIGTGTNWNNQPGYMTGADSFNASTSIGSAYNASGCQNPASSTAGFNVQGPLQISANSNASQITFALTNDSDEIHYNGTGFARYADNPTLQIQYGHTPTTPGASQLTASAGGSNTVACASAAPYPYVGTTIASNGITLTGANLTSPDADPLQANFKYWLTSTPGTTYTASSAFGIANGQSASIKLPSSFTSTLTNGTNVAWQMQTTNLQWPSGWSPVCTFTAEPTAPAPPTIAANSTYPAGVTGATADTAATFQISGDPSGATAAKFYYNLDQAPTTSGTPAGQVAMPVGTTASSPAHRWLLSGSGTDSVGASTVTLAAGASWGTDANRQNVMNSTHSTTSYATAGGPLLNTTASYSVSAWVKLTSTSNGDAVAVSQAGNNIGAFFLGYDANKTGWCFYGYNGDVMASGLTNWPGVCPTTDHPALNVWTLLTGVYDASAKTRALYVNGTLIGTGSDTTAFATSGALTIGDERYNATAAFNFPGQISDVQTYSRALTGTEVSAMYNTNNTNVTITPPSPGPHTLNVDAVDAAGDVSSTTSYSFIAKTHTGANCPSLATCFDNTAISSDSAPSGANADGTGNSLSVTDLGNAGWSSNGHVTIDGANLTLPAFGSGQADNVIAQNQVINYSYPVPTTGASSLMFLATATNGGYVDPGQITGDDTAPFIGAGTAVAGERCFTGTTDNGYCTPNGVITYAAGCAAATNNNQSYDLTVPDWTAGPSSPAAVALPHLNNPSGQKAKTAYLYPFAIPLYPGCTVQSITLPDNSTINGGTSAIHLFALGTRNTTTGTVESDGTTHATDSGKTWTGAWAEDTEGNYDFETGSFSNQSFRVLVQPSVTGNVVRVKLDNALGTSALHIGHATVALAAGNDINASAATASGSTPVNLTFANSASTVIPEGGMVFSDPLSFNVTSGQWLDVSFYLSSTATNLVQHSWATDAYEYAAPVGSGDHTADSAATAYTASGNVNGTFTDLVTGLDVETAGMPTQVVLGDNLIDAWQNNTAPLSPNQGAALRLTDDLANATPTTPAPWGTVNAGIESNQITVDNPETLTNVGAVGGPSASSRIDRDVLDEPGINTVILNQGLEDALSAPNILNGSLTLDQVTSNLEGAMTGLVGELAATPTTSSGTGFINTVALGLTPCGGYNGSGSTGTGTNANDPCNANVETVRTALNGNLSSGTGLGLSPYGSGSASFFYVDPDPVIGVTADNPVQLVPAAQVGTSRNNSPADPVNLTNAGIGALTNAILANQDVWQLTDGTGGNPAAQATDSAPTHYSNAYLTGTDPASGTNTLTLYGTEGTNYTWPTATVGANTNATVLGLDGTTGYADSGGVPVINTAASFSISAWADLPSLPTGNAAIASQSGASDSAFYFGYNYFHANKPAWDFYFATTDTTNPSFADAASSTAATGWTHLVGVYNATTKTAQLYVNGALTATTTGVTTWNATGAFTLGRSLYNGSPTDYFPGQISDVQAFNYALTAPQVTALYDQIQ